MNSESEKFILFTLEFPPFKGGISQYYQNLAEYWPSDNFYVLADNALSNQDSKNIKYCQLLNKYFRPRWLRAMLILRTSILKLGGNVHIIVGQILPLGIATYYLSKFLKFKYSIILHGLDFSLATESNSKKNITRKILLGAERVICANSYTASLVKFFETSLATKTFIVNPGIAPSFIRDQQKVEILKTKYNLTNKTVIFGLGRLVARKGVDMVIKAISMLDKNSQIVYAVAGAGEEEKNLKILVASLPEDIKNKILFLGQISNADRWAWLELCDIFIMASRNIANDYEGFGTVYLEANLAGKPVIAGDSGGVRDAVIDGINGFVVNSENPENIAQAITKLSQDEKLRHEFGEQGKRRVVENFNAKKQADKFYSYLKN